VAVIPDTGGELPPPEIEEDRGNHRVSTKRRKGTKGLSWGDMEVFSSTLLKPEATLEDRVTSKVMARLEPMMRGQAKGESGPSSPLPSASMYVQGRNRGRQFPGNDEGCAPPEKEGDVGGAEKEKKREETPEEARGSPQTSEGTPRTAPGARSQDTQPRKMVDSGPAMRTRARTRATTEAAAAGDPNFPFPLAEDDSKTSRSPQRDGL